MKTKSTLSRAYSQLLPSTIAVATALLAGGLSACDRPEQRADNEIRTQDNEIRTRDSETRAQERVDNAQDATSDAWITTKVKTALLEDSLTKGFEIEVTTVNGVVSLDGKVQSPETMTHAQKIAGDVKGVIKVDTTGLEAE